MCGLFISGVILVTDYTDLLEKAMYLGTTLYFMCHCGCINVQVFQTIIREWHVDLQGLSTWLISWSKENKLPTALTADYLFFLFFYAETSHLLVVAS